MILDPNYDWEWETRCKDVSWWCDDCEQLVPPELMAVSYQFELKHAHHRRYLAGCLYNFETCNHTREVGSCKDCWQKKEHKDRDSRKWSTLKERHYAKSRIFELLLAAGKEHNKKTSEFPYKDG